MWLGSGDFDIEDRVSASEGQSVIPSAAFGNYDEDVYGEIESYDVLSLGDFEDSEPMGFGRKMNRAIKKAKPKKLTKAMPSGRQLRAVTKKVAAPVRNVVPKPASPLRTMPKMGYRKRFLPKVASGIINVPKAAAPKITMPALKSAAAAAAIRKVGGVQSVRSTFPSVRGLKIGHKKKEAMVRPVSPGIEVVAAAGQPLKSSDVTPVAQIMQSVPATRVRSPYAHPLLAVSSGIGYYDEAMGFDLKSFLSKAKTDAKAALNKAVSDAQVKAKEAASSFLAKQSSKIISDPKVKALAKEEAEKAATTALAERLRSPETKAMAMNAGKVVLGLGAAFIAWKMYQRSQA